MKRNYLRLLALLAGIVTGITILGAMGIAGAYLYVSPTLPSAQAMRRVELQVPLRVYTRSGHLIAQIGEQRRIPVAYEDIPEIVKQAFLAAEDDRFFSHHGIDFTGVARAALVNVFSGERAQGASTITMQAARNMFLSPDKTWRRKIHETFLTYRMEREFTKQEIFGLYLNVIFFGQRAYGVAAAADTFFGKRLDELSVAEAATLAGLPKAPSRYNPIANPQLAQQRRGYVLRRMAELGFIDAAAAAKANAEAVVARVRPPAFDVEAPYVAEMARLEIRKRFGAAAETAGYRVYTTVDDRLQDAANRAVRLGLLQYDRRHGWRGPVAHDDAAVTTAPERIDAVLEPHAGIADLLPALVTSVAEKSVRVYVHRSGFAQIDWDGLSWARRAATMQKGAGPAPKTAADVVARGDIVHVLARNGVAQLVQVPEAQGALVSLDPRDGAIAALVGGFDYFSNKYNRVVQARRQAGSSFKPFLYSAALENGFTAASIILDAPIVMDGEGMEMAWRPENSGGEFEGPMRLREALVKSRNLVSIRILRELGIPVVADYVTRFGFDRKALPDNLTLALGTMQASPLEMATGFAVFANGGYRVSPYFIDRIEDPSGKAVWSAAPKIVCEGCEQQPGASEATSQAGGTPATMPETTPYAAEPAPAESAAESGGSTMNVGPSVDALTAADRRRAGPALLPPGQIAPRVITPQNDWLMTDMMGEVVTRGTARRAAALNRRDIAGKTGTTNDSRDAWFSGFSPALVATVWVGFDQERSLGESEEGGKTAVPIWVHFMREALRGVPDRRRPMPDGLVTMRISASTGRLASAEDPDAVLETFIADKMQGGASGTGAGPRPAQGPAEEPASTEQIF